MVGLLKIIGILVLLLVVIAAGFVALVWRNDIPYKKQNEKYLSAKSGFVDLGNNVNLHFTTTGKIDGPTIILVHGYGDSHFTWERIEPKLAENFRVYSVDLPGHGLTQAPKDYVLDSSKLADLIIDFTNKLDIKHFSIAGNSLGGGVSWQVAAKVPERVDNLILLAASGWPNKNFNAPQPLIVRFINSKPIVELRKHLSNKALTAQALRGQVGKAEIITPELLDRWDDLQLTTGHRHILLNIQHARTINATPEVLAKITAPTLIIHGKKDPVIDSSASVEFAKNIHGAQLVLLDDIGHLPQIEDSNNIGNLITDFVVAHKVKN